jgi:putative transposase
MNRPKSKREQDNEKISSEIKAIHKRSRQVYGILKITEALRFKGYRVNHKRVARLMRKLGIKSKVARKFRATTDSNHCLPVAENLLNREFHAEKRNQKWVSDITCVSSDEGWLYIAGVMDLCGQPLIGLSMSNRMTRELVINALDNAYKHAAKPKGVLIHSDRGSQYCSYDYQAYLKSHGFICSMSRKGDCWDNAPMEAFWGKMKTEWLAGRKFKTLAEAKAAVFEYVEIFYNRQRIHQSNGYLTPEAYYQAASN